MSFCLEKAVFALQTSTLQDEVFSNSFKWIIKIALFLLRELPCLSRAFALEKSLLWSQFASYLEIQIQENANIANHF